MFNLGSSNKILQDFLNVLVAIVDYLFVMAAFFCDISLSSRHVNWHASSVCV